MSAENHSTLIGNVTRDPELKVLPSGASYAKFGLAVNRRFFDKKSNDWKEQTSFFDIVAWQKLGDNVMESVKRGMRVTCNGELEQRSWEAQDGSKRSAVEFRADDVAISLKWATGSAVKNERSGNGGNYSGGGGAARAATSSAPAEDMDFEPFAGAADDEPF